MVDEEKLREPARRRAAQDEPERHAAADLRPSVLAGADARGVRPPDAAGQGAGAGAAAGTRRRSRTPIRPRSRTAGRCSASPSSTASASISAATRSKPGAGLGELGVEIAAAVDFDLQRVDAARRARVALDHVAAGERVVEPRLEAAARRRSPAPRALIQASAVRPRQSPNTIGGTPVGGGGIEWQSSRSAQPNRSSSSASCVLDRLVIGPVRLVEPLVELLGRDRRAATDSRAAGCAPGRCRGRRAPGR